MLIIYIDPLQLWEIGRNIIFCNANSIRSLIHIIKNNFLWESSYFGWIKERARCPTGICLAWFIGASNHEVIILSMLYIGINCTDNVTTYCIVYLINT